MMSPEQPAHDGCHIGRKIMYRMLGRGLAALALSGVVTLAEAQPYPNRPVNLLVVFAAGGPSDTIGRQLADHVGRQWNAQLVVENVVGAGGTIGTERGAKAAADGYTILTHHSGLTAAPALYSNLRFDPRTAFEPLGLINTGPMVLLSRKTLETKDMKELVAFLKEKGDKATIGFAGVGANSYVCGMVLQQMIGTRLAMVAYRGTGPAMNDLVAGQIDVLCDQATTAVPQILGGTVKAYSLTSKDALASLPNVPTNVAAGFPQFDVTIWNGVYAPKGTPVEILDKWNAAINTFVTDPAIVERLAATGTVPFPPEMRTRAAHAQWLTAQFAFYEKLFSDLGIKKEDAK
jgi:tripartite-type tricarboxylate transporter receptor subunit TctC